ncbi:hypothetical protein GCM10007874_10840 [Labrys miyagiensis]|uniref:Uncharacterized protein n=1 Tax=Labrys miyagiensis TaxID=346912 RepID=A0ABQ6CEI6_9HYPH|nr:hypothetical protein GCM10007874_10840 [Labrys miyagiensis]
MAKVYNYEVEDGGTVFVSGVKRTMASIRRVGVTAQLHTEEEVPDEKVDAEGRYFPPLFPTSSTKPRSF